MDFDDWSGLWEEPLDFDASQWPTIPNIPGIDDADFLSQLDNLSDDDWSSLFRGSSDWLRYIPRGSGGGGGGGGGGSSNWLSRLFSGGGGGGGSDLASLLSLLATTYGGLNNKESTAEAQRRMEKAVEDANASTRSILGPAGDAYKPYQEAGAGALQKLASMPESNLAAGFGPIGQASTLAAGVRPVGGQSNLAAQFRPLGRR